MNRNYFIHSITEKEFDSIMLSGVEVGFNIDRISELVGYKVLSIIMFKVIRDKGDVVFCIDLYVKRADKN